jgi:nucleoside-diphosphate-sugar epimerase
VTSQRIVLTGGAGFIGTHLAEHLGDRNQLILLDNLRRNSLRYIPALRELPNVQFQQADVLDPKGLEQAMDGADTVLHLAAIAGVSSYYRQPLDTLKVNLLGTINVLDAAVAAGVKTFIYFSTSEVFGPDAMWVSEESPHQIGGASDRRWVYATSKLAGEQFVMRYGEAYGFGCAIVRPFNIYGPRQTGEGAIANFCAAAVKGEPLIVYGDGTPLRAWCYVSDFVAAVSAILERPDATGRVFNVGNPAEVTTTLGLARQVARLVPGTEIRFQETSRTDVRARVPLIEKARRLLGWEPKISLEEGLLRTLDWHKGLDRS